MQLNDKLAELQVDIERIRLESESAALRYLDASQAHNEELRGLSNRIERLRAAMETKP